MHALEQRISPVFPPALSLHIFPSHPPCCLQADEIDHASDPDAAPPLDTAAASGISHQPEASASQQQQQQQQPETGLVAKQKSALRKYVESFDQETMLETARWVGSAELVGWLYSRREASMRFRLQGGTG